MTLQPGTWLNHYQILGHLGTGGMGEVYRALDNKLQREVALKVLPKAFAQDPERLARFRREAQVLAQLNHVNIAAIYNLEQSGETHFLVMELALGETLRDKIREQGTGNREQKGGIPLEEALEICKQIAAGLECAHEKPIVHRDLKPANIKVSSEGVVKILDFGLARAFAGDNASSDPADSPTLSAMTAPGTILGTAAYMSPEQARGKKVDKRTDIWALGCVLYELLTGQQAFDPSRDRQGAGHQSPDREGGGNQEGGGQDSDPRDTIADIIGAVLYKEPDWNALPATTPHWVRVQVRRVWGGRGLCPGLFRTRWEVADFDRRRRGTRLGAQRAGTLLPHRGQDDGGGDSDSACLQRGHTAPSLRGRVCIFALGSQLRRQRRRPALPDAQAERGTTARDANQRGAELV
jgi:serine/threonine protein kinase